MVYLTTLDDVLVKDELGRAVATTTDVRGRYRLPTSPGHPCLVNAVLEGDRRMVGLVDPAGTGAATVDISVASTYVAEFWRHQVPQPPAPPPAWHEVERAQAIASTSWLIDQGLLAATPSLAPGDLPLLREGYLAAMAAGSSALLDLWGAVLGRRPRAVTTVPGAVDIGYLPSALLPVGPGLIVAELNTTGTALREAGQEVPFVRSLAIHGSLQVTAVGLGPDGDLFWAEQVDRGLGGALARDLPQPTVRLFHGPPGEGNPREVRLALPPELQAYLATTGRDTWVEPSALA
jgi:hypothetical protein